MSSHVQRVAQALHRIGKLYVSREVRAKPFDDAFHAELAAVYQPQSAPVRRHR
jgi:hypothetical protein